MLLIAADTSGRAGVVALARGEIAGTCKLIEVFPLDGGAFSAQLIPQIAALLAKQGFSKKDIGGFVVVSGPGSFTGLRVGLAAIKALAEVLARPIGAVSLLEAIALVSGLNGKVTAALNAGRQQVYIGEYEVSSGARLINEGVAVADEFTNMVRGQHVVTPSSEIAALAGNVAAEVHIVIAPEISAIAAIGWRKILAGETVSPESLEANYISRANAEILARAK